MSASSPPIPAVRSTWIISPLWDSAFLIATPVVIVPVVWYLSQNYASPEMVSLLVASFASLAHHLPGFMRCYGDRELFDRFHWRFLLAPPMLMAVALLFTFSGYHGLLLLLLLWGTWHGLMQTYGFMRIYDLKAGVRDQITARLDFSVCFLIFVAGVVFSDARVYSVMATIWECGAPTIDSIWLVRFRWLTGISLLVAIAGYLVNLLRLYRAGQPIRLTKIFLALTTGWIYWTTGMITTNVLIGVAMFEIFHAIQYYAIVWTYNRRLADRVGQRFGLLGFLFQDRFAFLGLYLAAILAFGSLRLLGDGIANPTFQKAMLALISTSTLLHFYFDGFIWKVRERKTQVNLDIERHESSPLQLAVPALTHGAKWAVLLLLLGGVYFLEHRQTSHLKKSPEFRQEIVANLAAWTPRLPEVQSLRCREALERGDTNQACELARQVVGLRPRTHAAHAQLGAALLAAGEHEQAAAAYRQAKLLVREPWEKEFYTACELEAAGDWQGVEQALKKADALNPNEPEVLSNLADAYRHQGKYRQAADEYRRMLQVKPDSLRTRLKLIDAVLLMEDYSVAVEQSRLAVQQAPNSSAAHLALGKSLNANKEYQDAIASLEESLALDESSAEAYYHLGLARILTGAFADAQVSLRRAIKIDPEHPMAHFQLGNASSGLGDWEGAERQYARAAQLSPNLVAAVDNLVAVQFEQEKFEEAKETYRQAIQRHSENASFHYNLALLLMNENEFDEARQLVRRAQRLGFQPEPEVLHELGL